VNKVMLSGYYGYNNAGDEAILKAIINGLKQTVPNLEIVVLSSNPKETKALYNVKSINRFSYLQIILELQRTSLLISGGGSLLQDVTGKLTIPYYLSIIKLAQMLNVKTMIFAQGIGPIKSNYLIKKIGNVLDKIDVITVRDKESKILLENLEIENVELSADPVFFLQPGNKDRIKEILVKEEVPFNESGPWIGVAIRDWDNRSVFVKEIALALDKLIANYDAQILLIPFHADVDKEVLEEIKGNMHADKQTYIISKQYEAHELLGICDLLDLMIGMRLHSLIFAARTKTPIVGISYDIKIDSLMKQLGSCACCNTGDINSSSLYKDAAEILSKKKGFLEMNELVSDLEQSAWQSVIRAVDLLAGRI